MARLVPRVLLAALALSSGLLHACDGDDPMAAPPGTAGAGPRPDGGGPVPRPPRRDSGMNDPDSGDDDSGAAGASGSAADAGSAGSVAPSMGECRDFDPMPFAGGDPMGEVIASSAQPADFEITRAVATWETNCAEPTIRVDLSDGSCPNGQGHQLTFWFSAEAIELGAIFPGQYTIFPETDMDAVTIRYTRPSRLSPTGIWGTCALATGILDLVGEVSTDQFADLQVSRFFLDLTPCDGRANDVMTVEGSFNVELQRGLREACPLD